jgi:hypothetical protein
MRKLLLENRFPRIWVPSPENRDVRQLLWHRHRLVQMRTRIMNQLQAAAMNEGYRWKKNCLILNGYRKGRIDIRFEVVTEGGKTSERTVNLLRHRC